MKGYKKLDQELPWKADNTIGPLKCFIPYIVNGDFEMIILSITIHQNDNMHQHNWEPTIRIRKHINELGQISSSIRYHGAGVLFYYKKSEPLFFSIEYKKFLQALIDKDKKTLNKYLFPDLRVFFKTVLE
jgi:hypothetical protein